MTMLYPDKCFNAVCYKGTACYEYCILYEGNFLARHIVVVFGWKS